MAFSTSNVVANSQGSLRSVSGDWTGSAGDSAGSYTVGSARVVSYDFDPGLGSSGPAEKALVSASVSSGQTTLSVFYHQTITAGKFLVVFK